MAGSEVSGRLRLVFSFHRSRPVCGMSAVWRVQTALHRNLSFRSTHERQGAKPSKPLPPASLSHAGKRRRLNSSAVIGCLLANHLGIELRRVGSGKRLTFSTGEAALSQWLEENARVTWHVCERPWELEEELISRFNLPLNLDMNVANTFHPVLSELPRAAKAKARALPILPK